ncbi:MAG: hypothetical protein L0Z50_41245 [Verrucomicrobiales bacterium]|nr:hypothetical protein [Verrucomicrobiales bacterium]
MAVAIRLRKGSDEWRYSPAVVQIVQAVARIGDQNVQLTTASSGNTCAPRKS